MSDFPSATELKSILNEADEFLGQNLEDACREILAWSNTAILPEGVVRDSARRYFSKLDPYRDLVMAENAVKRLAMERIIALTSTENPTS